MALRDRIQSIQQREADQNTGIVGDVTDLVQKGAIDALSGVAEFVGAERTADSLGQWSEEQMQTLSPEMKQSMAKRFINDDLSLGEGVKDWRSWVGQGAVLVGQMVPSLLPAGGVARGAQALGAGARLASGSGTLTSLASNAAIASGMQGQQVEDEVMNLPYDDLRESPQFRTLAAQYAEQGLPAEEVLTRAKRDIATQARDQVMRDPTLIGVNALAGMVGDKGMTRLISGKLGQTIRGNVAKGAIAEGGTESFQGGFGQYVMNVAQNEAGLEVDAMEGVVAAALEEGLIAGGLGATAGGVGGTFRKITAKQNAREKIEPLIEGKVDELAATGFDREAAKAEIERMAQEAAIRMGNDAETAAEVAAESVAASTGEGPTIQEQSERIVNSVDENLRAARARDTSDIVAPNPADFGLTPEQAELLIDPDPELSPDQQAELYRLRSNPMAGQYFQAETNYRIQLADRRAPAPDPTANEFFRPAGQPTQPTMAEPTKPTSEPTGQPTEPMVEPTGQPTPPVGVAGDAAQLQEYFDSGLPADYQPTEAAQRVRGQLGVDLANQLRAEELASGQPTTTTPAEAVARVRGQTFDQRGDQVARETGLDQMQADQQAWDEAGQTAAETEPARPQTTPIEQDVVEQPRQPAERQRLEDLTPQQQVDYLRDRGAQFGLLGESPQLGQREAAGASPRLAKKNTAKLNRKLNTIFDRIAQANPQQIDDTQTFGYQPNTAMADAFAALQPTTETPTPEQFNSRVDELVNDGIINSNEADQLKKSVREVAYDVAGRTERMRQAAETRRRERGFGERPMTETGVPIDEVAGEYQSVSAVADQQWDSPEPTPPGVNNVNDVITLDGEDHVITSVQSNPPYINVVNPETNESRVVSAEELDSENIVVHDVNDEGVEPAAQEVQPSPEPEPEGTPDDYDVEADLGPDFEQDYGMAEQTPPAPKVFEGATYDPQSRLGDTEWQQSGGWESVGATIDPSVWAKADPDNEYVVTPERDGKAYSIWSRPKETTGQTMESGKEYDWDDDVVRFSDESGRVQIRGQNETKWRNMKFNWMDKFTEETGVTIPEEYREAHRQPRRDRGEPKETVEVVEPTQEEFEAAEAAKAKAEKSATAKAKRLERERNKEVIGEYNGIDKTMARMRQLGVMETHYPHKLRAGAASKAKFEIRKLPEKVEGTFTIHGWSTDTMSGFFIEGAKARELKPFAMLAGEGRNTMVQNAPDAMAWQDVKGIGLKTVPSRDFLKMVIDRGGKFDSRDAAISEMIDQIQKGEADPDADTTKYFDATQSNHPAWNKDLSALDYRALEGQEFTSDNPSNPEFAEVSTKSFKGQKTYKDLRVSTWVRMNKFMPKAFKLVEDNFDSIQNATPPYSDINGLYNRELSAEVGDATGGYVIREAMEQHYKDVKQERAQQAIESEAKAKTDKIMASAKTGEFMSQFRRLRSGQIKPDQVVRGASSATHPRKAAFEWLYKEINNADPQNEVLTGVGLGSNGKPFKSETGARNQGKASQASAVVPASSIIDGEEGFVWVKYRDKDPEGTPPEGGEKPTKTAVEKAQKNLPSKAEVRKNIALELFVPGLTPKLAASAASRYMNSMSKTGKYKELVDAVPEADRRAAAFFYDEAMDPITAPPAVTKYLNKMAEEQPRTDGWEAYGEPWIASPPNKRADEMNAENDGFEYKAIQHGNTGIYTIFRKPESIGETDVSDTAGSVERDTSRDTLDQTPSESERRRLIRERDREVDAAVEQGRTAGRREPSIPATGPLDAGTSNIDNLVESDGKPSTPTGVTGSADPRGNDLPSGARVSMDEAATEAAISGQVDDGVELTREQQQQAADKVEVKLNDAANIDKTLPLLSPEQRTDVVAAEKRLYGQKKKGMMFTNGTGTGKTYTGCGVIKRQIQMGGKVLVVAPAGTIKGWQNAAKDLQFTMAKLKDKSSGLGDNSSVITSYQNFSDNQALLQDKFDLVVYDEAHKIMANMQGDSTKATSHHYAVTGLEGKSRGSLVYRPDIDKVKADMLDYQKKEKEKGNEISDPELYQIPRFRKRLDALDRKIQKLDKQFARMEKKEPTKALFLSASPFSGHKSVFYADGYLFDTNEGFKEGGYNSGNPQQQFMVKNFGYRMRYNKANYPGPDVDVGILERDWADQMFESGAMVGRTLNLTQDYSRQFPEVEKGVGAKVDQLFNVVTSGNDYPELSKMLYKWRKNGTDRQLAEALRVAGSLDRIEEHLKLGRKVVVFHQRMEMTITDPFASGMTPEGREEYKRLQKERPDLLTMSFVGLNSAPQQIIDHFGPDRVGLFNGQSTKTRNADLKDFNTDGGSKDILVIQKDAGKEGLSAHDVTGEHQRALIITNTPQSPADAIQMEGRIYRFGLQSNAIIEYPTVQTNFEKIAFRDVVSNRTATAENLAMGSQARMLRSAFRDGYMEPYQMMPNNDQGIGGKDSDRNTYTVTELTRAKTHYYKRAKRTAATKSAEGSDYFATPEPVGLSMVNMAGLLAGESVLEPSAGHGAIAHWFPESVTATAIEQSPELIGDLSMFTDADVRHQDFEALNIVNKYDAVVMNPPFGHGGSLAMQHIDKATRHLNNGGRVVAIYPMGGLADKRFDAWYEKQDGIYLTADIKLPGVTFKRAGTGVMTRILVLDKDTSGDAVYNGQKSIDYTHITDANELFDKIYELSAPPRPDVQVKPSEIGMSYIETDKSYIAELSGFTGSSGPARTLGKKELRKIAERYFGEIRTDQGFWNDTHYAFETDKDRQRFAKAVLETYNKEYKREKDTTVTFKDDDEIRFSKVSTGNTPEPVRLPTDDMTKQDVIDFIEQFKREYNGNIPLTITAFENTYEAYQERARGLPERFHGGYVPSQSSIHVFADAHRDAAIREQQAVSAEGRGADVSTAPTDKDAVDSRSGVSGYSSVHKLRFERQLRKTLRHEILGHFGLDTLSPLGKKALLERINATKGKARFKDVWDHVNSVYDGDSDTIKAEEFFARFAETLPNESDPLWQRILDTFVVQLQKIGLFKGEVTRQEIYDTIKAIDKGLKSGDRYQRVQPVDQIKLRKQSPEDVETIANDFIAQYEGLSNVNVLVVPNQDSLAEITNATIEAGTTVKGAYMPASDTIVMVADNLVNSEDARRVLRHELIAHKGLMETLSDKDAKLLTKQVMGLRNSKPLADIWGTVEKSYTNAPDSIKAEEVIARIAEEPRGTLGQVADQVISWVMGAMRRTGLLSREKITLAEVRNMLNGVDKNLRTNSGRLTGKIREGTFFSKAIDGQADVSIEDALNAHSNQYIAGIKKTISRFGVDALKENWMGALTLRQIADLRDKIMGGRLSKYLDTVNQMLVVQNNLAEQVAERVDKVRLWASKNRAAADELFKVMHNSTIENVDPSAKFESMTDILREEKADIESRLNALLSTSGVANKRRGELIARSKEIEKELKSEPLRRQKHAKMKREYDKLTPEAKQHFVEMRDHYAEQRGRMQETLLNNIEKAKVNNKAKAVMLRQLRFDMERAKKGLYFPLSRFGNYWIDSVDLVDGERYFMMYDTEAEMKSAKNKLISSGYKEGEHFTSGTKLQESRSMAGASMGFVNDVINELQTANINQAARDDLTDLVYQLYLQSMPERSIRKNFIHRKGVAGFNQDAIRAMADQGVKQSRQQARLQFVDELEEQMVGIRDFAKKDKSIDVTRTANEMTKRHEWVKNPQRAPWAQKMTSFGFYWMLGVSPASALMNLVQTPQIAIGVLGSRHGNLKSISEVMKATKDFVSAIGAAIKAGGRKGVMYYGVTDNERQALEYGADIGALDTTQMADLTGLADNPSATYNGRIESIFKKMGFLFHYAEIMNREVTYLAAYRMEMEKNGGNHKAAADYAVKATWDSHFDYGSLNRARVMQGDVAAVALQFKQYSQSVTYFLASNAFRSMKGATPEEKRVARRQLTWTLGMTFATAGMAALPLMSAVMSTINVANDMFGDDDEPWDAETEFKAMLTEYFGEDVSKQIWYGHASTSGRMSLNDLWFRDPNRDLSAEDTVLHYIQQGLGPVAGGVLMQAARGLKDINQGNTMRGVESFLPKAAKDIIRTYRYTSEGGVTNRQGDLIVEDLDIMELSGQLLGFAPSRTVYRYDQNSAMKGYEQTVVKRRSSLMQSYYMAWRQRDREAMKNVMAKISKFNRSKWGRANPITATNIKQSIKRRQSNLMKSDRGLLVSPKLERLVNESTYWQ